MWVAKPPKPMSADEYFVYVVQLISLQYNVRVTINSKECWVEFHTDDEMLIRTMDEEIREALKNAKL